MHSNDTEVSSSLQNSNINTFNSYIHINQKYIIVILIRITKYILQLLMKNMKLFVSAQKANEMLIAFCRSNFS